MSFRRNRILDDELSARTKCIIDLTFLQPYSILKNNYFYTIQCIFVSSHIMCYDIQKNKKGWSVMKQVLITGASRGIGAAIARKFAEEGMSLTITGFHNGTALQMLRKEIESNYHVTCRSYVCDMGDFASVERMFAEIPAPDILINNAGISYFGLLSDMSIADWQTVLNTNLNAAFYTSKLAIPHMVHEKWGKIINISSVWGNVGASMEVAYSVSKGGINALTKALAKELAPSNIQVNAIAPGMIDTAMNRVLSAEDIASIIEEIPADRMGTPEEAALLVWQVVNSPSYMTGQIITLDGGWI